jgi:hypothetical protein
MLVKKQKHLLLWALKITHVATETLAPNHITYQPILYKVTGKPISLRVIAGLAENRWDKAG